jgi:hypothetical protein
MVALKLSAAALSAPLPTALMDCRTLALRQASAHVREVYRLHNLLSRAVWDEEAVLERTAGRPGPWTCSMTATGS